MEAAQQQTPQMNLPQMAAPPPQIQPQEKKKERPKLAFETPGARLRRRTGHRQTGQAEPSVQDALNAVTQGGSGGAVVSATRPRFRRASAVVSMRRPCPASPAPAWSCLAIRRAWISSPYLIQVLAEVKLNWFNVWPGRVRAWAAGAAW